MFGTSLMISETHQKGALLGTHACEKVFSGEKTNLRKTNVVV